MGFHPISNRSSEHRGWADAGPPSFPPGCEAGLGERRATSIAFCSSKVSFGVGILASSDTDFTLAECRKHSPNGDFLLEPVLGGMR